MALAAMDSEPVAYMTYKGYLLHAGDPKLAEYSEPMPLYADPRPEPISAEPVAWLLSGGGAKNVVVFDSGNAYADLLREVTPLYRHAQPVPVVSADLLHTAASAIEDLLEHTDPNTSYYSGVWADVPGKLRAAMFQAKSLTGNSPVIGIDLASGPDRTVEVHYVAPPGYVMVPKEPTEAMMLHNSGCQHHAWDDPDCAMRQTRRLIWSHMLAAAPQEVK